MLPIVLSSLALAKKRRLREILSPRLKDLMDNWELRVLVSLSLIIQVVLIILGNRRKKIRHYWIRIVVWCAYLSADSVAIYALGITPGELQKLGVRRTNIDPTAELRGFWAPFLLMHLGGPDTITANSLEDNELWLRHCLALVSQTVATLYILFLSWSSSYLSWLYIVILICGLIKYGERVWVLWAASSEQFRDSTPERQQQISKIVEKQKLKEAEGYFVVPHQVIEPREVWNHEVDADWGNRDADLPPLDLYKRRQGQILVASGMIDISRPAFNDLLLNLNDRDSGKSTLEVMYCLSSFDVTAIELGLIYDLLFTKAMVLQTPWGIASRVVSLSLTGVAFVVFAVLSNKASYDRIDQCITFALLGIAFFLELYALLVHLFSDKVANWLIKRNHSFMLDIINRIQPLDKRQRWSNKIGQFNLLSYSLKEKHLRCHKILGFLGMDDKVEKSFYLHSQDVSLDLKYYVVEHFNWMPTMYKDLQSFWTEKWGRDAHRMKQLESLKWSTEFEFDMCVLIWHIATHVCKRGDEEGTLEVDRGNLERMSLDLSRYMLYLLVMYPFMLPAGIGRIKFHDMYAVMTAIFEQHQSSGNNGTTTNQEKIPKQKCCPEKPRLGITDACDLLLVQVNTQLDLKVPSGEKSKFVMVYGCQLASQLMKMDRVLRWLIVSETWIAMLVLAALKCKTSYHAQQLTRGGELLTHIWLLLVHYGFTDHFQIPHAAETAELIIK